MEIKFIWNGSFIGHTYFMSVDGVEHKICDFGENFKIWFNGELLHSSKTLKSFEKRLNILIEKWNLKRRYKL